MTNAHGTAAVNDSAHVLAPRTAVSGTWAVGARLLSRALDLLTMLALAHLLAPKDFGLVAIAMTVVLILEAVLEMPVSQAMVRLHSLDAAHYDTAFTLSVARGIAVSSFAALISLPFARFYHDLRLVPLICVLGIAPAARGLVSPRLADYARKLDFSRDFFVEFAGKLSALIVAVSLAVSLRSYWALAAGTVTSTAVAAGASYLLAPYRPRLTLRELRSFSGFLGWITVAQTISAVNWQSDRLLLGKLTSRSALGLFTTANDLSSIPTTTFFGPILRPLLSAFSLVRGDPRRLANSYQVSTCALITVGLPMLVGDSLVAEPAVRLLFGEKWLGAAPMLRWLSLSLIPSLFAIPLGPLVMSLDRTRIFVKRNSFEFCVKLPLVIVGAIKFGFLGVIFARIISETATAIYCMLIARRLLGISFQEQLLRPWRSVLSTAGMAAVTALCAPHLANLHGKLPLGAGLLLTVVTAASVYCTLLFLFWSLSGQPQSLESFVFDWTARFLHRRELQAALR
jgi:O-antigen/teichoic acid export membrane protein